MRRLIKLICLVICGAMLAVAAAGCKSGGGDEDDTPETKVVRIWVHKSEAEDEGKVYSAIAEAFNESEFKTEDGRTIRMRIEFYNDASTLNNAINSVIVTGGLPDIIAVDAPNVVAYASEGVLTDISGYIDDDTLDDYVDSVIEQGTYNGGLYALSAMDAPTGLYYNKALLKEVGYTDADFGTIERPWSWPEVLAAMTKLKTAGKAYKIKLNLGFGGEEGCIYLYAPLVYSAGGSFVGTDGRASGAFDSDATINGLKMLEPFFDTDANGETWVYDGSNDDALAQGEVAFEVHGPWSISSIKRNYAEFIESYDIMPLPVYEAGGVRGTAGAGCGSWCFGVTPNAKDKHAAAKAVEYFTGAFASQLLYESIGTFPTHKSLFDSITDFGSGPALSMANILTEIATPRPKAVNYPKITSAFNDLLSYVQTKYGASDYNLKNYASELCVNIDAGI
ncbi:MAG: extracellular solute-binding protein [Clostridia bacterium]|nr:extracellular solute-binding protein [Clostridia bacterium]